MSINNRLTIKAELFNNNGRDLTMIFDAKQPLGFNHWADRFRSFLVAHYNDDRISEVVIKFHTGEEASSTEVSQHVEGE